MRIGIDLLWVRVGVCGGTEAYIRSLMDGFMEYAPQHEYVLFVAKDNAESFEAYAKYPNVTIHVCNINCANQGKRILWENCFLDKAAKTENVEVMFVPVYSKPMTHGSGIPYVCVIHDLQAMHYPEYFSKGKRLFLKYTWGKVCKTSDEVITISNYCKDDLIEHYPVVKNKIVTIYNPVVCEESGLDFQDLEKKYGIEKNKYFYCVSSMLPHKNLNTILQVMKNLKDNQNKDEKLVISGVGGNTQAISEVLKDFNIEEQVILTGFVSNQERDCLYENCKMFLFPSIFEGFGIPPIEALQKGKNVVMTQKSCLKEVTEGRAIYVDDPMNVEEWVEKIEVAQKKTARVEVFENYKLENVIKQYIDVLTSCKRE